MSIDSTLSTILQFNDITGTFGHDSISKIGLREVDFSLKEVWKNDQALNNSFQHTSEVGANATKESEIEKEQIDCIVGVENK